MPRRPASSTSGTPARSKPGGRGAVRSAPKGGLRGADLLTLATITPDQARDLLDLAQTIKKSPARFGDVLAGQAAVLLFEKPSLRTRLSFEVGIAKLGGHAVYMDHGTQRLGVRESVADYGRNLERWVECIIARVFEHRVLVEMAAATRVPVINALSERFHPCQALADVFTLREEFGELRGLPVAYVGDGNNVCHSLMHACAMLGVRLTVITPPGFAPAEDVVSECRDWARRAGAAIEITSDLAAVRGVAAVYTDVWASMGQADQTGKRMKVFAAYQVNRALMDRAGPEARFMHCLPAHRGLEVTDEVIDSKHSLVYEQAENRMWAQNALLVRTLAK